MFCRDNRSRAPGSGKVSWWRGLSTAGRMVMMPEEDRLSLLLESCLGSPVICCGCTSCQSCVASWSDTVTSGSTLSLGGLPCSCIISSVSSMALHTSGCHDDSQVRRTHRMSLQAGFTGQAVNCLVTCGSHSLLLVDKAGKSSVNALIYCQEGADSGSFCAKALGAVCDWFLLNRCGH